MGVPIRQPEMFVMPKMKQDNGQSAAIPRLCPNKYRRESYLTFRIDCKNKLLFKLHQDSHLRGNDEELTISCVVLGFAKVSV